MPPKPKKDKVPDAWDDDWEPDTGGAPLDATAKPESPLSKAEKLARHHESNKRLWQSADAPEEPQYLPATNDVVPLPSAFKPVMKVLSRRPVAGTASAVADEEELRQAAALHSPDEIRLRQQRDLEEKQRKYEEARAKIFGKPAPVPSSNGSYNNASGASTPGNVTPPTFQQQQPSLEVEGSGGRQSQRGRGRGRGGGDRGFRLDFNGSDGVEDVRRPPAQARSRELYDPNSSPRPGSSPFPAHRRGGGDASASSRSGTPREEDQTIRAPRGPDRSGHHGFRFARRGGSAADTSTT